MTDLNDMYVNTAFRYIVNLISVKLRELNAEERFVIKFEEDPYKYFQPIMIELGSRLQRDSNKENE